MRASIRPKKISTNGRATWVESTRSCGAWKVATLSEKEWRSAAEGALGANGSWTWTMSSGRDFSSRLTGSPVAIRSTSCPRRSSSSETRGRELGRRVRAAAADREDLGDRERRGGHGSRIRAASGMPGSLVAYMATKDPRNCSDGRVDYAEAVLDVSAG